MDDNPFGLLDASQSFVFAIMAHNTGNSHHYQQQQQQQQQSQASIITKSSTSSHSSGASRILMTGVIESAPGMRATPPSTPPRRGGGSGGGETSTAFPPSSRREEDTEYVDGLEESRVDESIVDVDAEVDALLRHSGGHDSSEEKKNEQGNDDDEEEKEDPFHPKYVNRIIHLLRAEYKREIQKVENRWKKRFDEYSTQQQHGKEAMVGKRSLNDEERPLVMSIGGNNIVGGGDDDEKIIPTNEKIDTSNMTNAEIAAMYGDVAQLEEQGEKVDEGDAQEELLPQDTDTYLITSNVCSWPFYTGLIVCVLQSLMFGLLAATQWDGPKDNPLMLPADVEMPVRITQFLAVAIAIFVQNDLRVALELIHGGYDSSKRFGDPRISGLNFKLKEASVWKWWFALFEKMFLGAAGLFVAFLMIVQSDNVFDLLLNFTGVAFVSEIDEIAFLLGANGFLGEACKAKSEEIRTTPYLVPSSTRSKSVNRAVLLGSIGFTMYFFFFWIAYKQYVLSGYLCSTIHLEFTDGVVPLLGTYSGLYDFGPKWRRPSGRITYIERRGSHSSSQTKRGVLAYCGSDSKWTFSTRFDVEEKFDPCVDFVVQTESTTTFDVLDLDSDGWASTDGTPVEGVRMSCPDNPNSVLDPYGCFGATVSITDGQTGETKEVEPALCKESCPQLTILAAAAGFVGNRGNEYAIDYEALSFPKFHSYGRPVYWGVSSTSMKDAENDCDDEKIKSPVILDLVFFTGSRWVITDTSQFPDIQVLTEGITKASLNALIEDVFKGDFHVSHLPGKPGSIEFVSEVVTSAVATLSPLGLEWYHASYDVHDGENDISPVGGSGDEELYVFPSPDLTRPAGAIFSCRLCDDDTNPCYFGGTCEEDSTCTCANGATGTLCEIAPLANGRCNPYFNTPLYQWDLGDCCGASCDGPACDEFVPSLFGLSVEDHILTGFPNCEDPDMVPVSIKIEGYYDAVLGLHCDDKRFFLVGAGYFGVDATGEETVYVRDGTKCELRFTHIYDWDNPFIAIRYNVGSDIEYQIMSSNIIYADYAPLIPIDEDEDAALNQTDANIYAEHGFYGEDNFPHDVTIEFRVISSCLLHGLSDTVDFNELVNESSPRGNGLKWLDQFVSDGTVCGNKVLKQQYAMAVLSYFDFFEPGDHCEWPIVTCNSDGSVLGITSREGFFEGENQKELITELQLLVDLETLILPGFYVGSSLPTWFGDFSKLKVLDMDAVGLTGTLPSELGRLTNMENIRLDVNFMTGTLPSELGLLSNMEIFILGFNDFSGTIPTEFMKLTNLEQLWFDGNQISGPLPSFSTEFSKLYELYLNTNMLTGTIPTDLGVLTNMARLLLHENYFTGQIPSEIFGSMPNLEVLNLKVNSLGTPLPSEIGLATNLKDLRLQQSGLSGTLPTEIGLATNLEELNLSESNLWGQIPKEFGNLVNLEYLFMYYTFLSGWLPGEVGNLSSLIQMDMGQNFFTGTIPTTFGMLNRLAAVNFFYNQLNGPLPTEIGNCTRLQEVIFDSNQLTGEIPSELGNIRHLQWVYLGNNSFTSVPSELTTLPKLEYIDVSSNDDIRVPVELVELCDNKEDLLCQLGDYEFWEDDDDPRGQPIQDTPAPSAVASQEPTLSPQQAEANNNTPPLLGEPPSQDNTTAQVRPSLSQGQGLGGAAGRGAGRS